MGNSQPVSPVKTSIDSSKTNRGAHALQLMRDALKLIDENDGPHDAGAHLDVAISRLEEWLVPEAKRSD